MTIKKNIILIGLFIFIVLSLFINKLTTPRVLSTNELLINGLFLFENPKQISDFSFYSANGEVFNKTNLNDKWTLMYFGFTRCPDECPTTMYQISKLVKVLREKEFPLHDKQWVLVSIDPERDTPEDINKYAKGFDASFIGVSNTRPMLLNLATQLSVNNVMPSGDKMDHSHLDNHVNNIILLNPKGEFAGVFRPPFDISRLSLTYQSITSSK
ncbi:MAG: SCO family protein [Gammaproteobacteria bacterium TMED225]|jgi:protein SCO1/2|nr:MAG: SCO family protein [Gammaproteobacteria bacterium TMED225]|tara:strand:+ start:988 stop:1626 length:639 start_codon:yes stop_codon:yes gene_type:complete